MFNLLWNIFNQRFVIFPLTQITFMGWRVVKPNSCNFSKNWSFTCLSVTKTAKSDRLCIGRKKTFVPYSLKGLQFRSDYMGLPDSGYRRPCQNVSLISTDTHLQRHLTCLSATTSGRSPYHFLFTTRCCTCADKQLCDCQLFHPSNQVKLSEGAV